MERQFLQELKRLAVSQSFLRLLSDTLLDGWEEMFTLRTSSDTGRLRGIAELESKRRRVFELREDGSYTPEVFRERLASIEEAMAALRLAPTLPSLPTKEDVLQLLSAAEALLLAPDEHWEALPPHLRPPFQRHVFPGGIFLSDVGAFRTSKPGLPFELNRQFARNNSTWVDPRVPHSEILAYLQELIAIVSPKSGESSAAA